MHRSALQLEPQGKRCPLCEANSLESISVRAHDAKEPQDMTVLRCIHCDFAWQWPLVRTPEESVQYFEQSYDTAAKGSYFDRDKKREICALELEFLNSLVGEKGTLLDVGSGDGTFAGFAFEDGWTTCAIDPAGPERQETRDGRCFRQFRGALSDLDEDERFDVVTMWDVVEHLDRPLELIDQCRNRLAPDGWLVLETGNFQSTGRVLAGKNWWAYQNDHRWYFTPDSLQEILQKAGFETFRLCTRTLRPWIKDSGKYEGPPIGTYLLAALKRLHRAPAYVDEFRQLLALQRRYPDTANIQIFTLAAQRN